MTELESPIAAPFRVASSLRRKRVFHPDGVVLRGDLVVLGDGVAGTELFAPGRRSPALVRLSRGIGLPESWPDVLGLAVKVPDAYGPNADQDFLLVSTASPGPLRRVLAPAASIDARPYSSLLPVEIGGARAVVGATVDVEGDASRTLPDAVVAAGDRRLRITLLVGDLLGRRWREVASIACNDVLPGPDGARLAFDPWNSGGGIQPVGLLNRVRRSAYAASRRGRSGR